MDEQPRLEPPSPPVAGAPGQAENLTPDHRGGKGLSIVAMILGISGVVPGLGTVTSLVGLILALRAGRRQAPLASAALAVCGVGLALSLIVLMPFLGLVLWYA